MKAPKTFSKQLREWLASDAPKTVKSLDDIFGERSFAILFLVFMALPALPIPTGGITHILEVICLLLALEMIVGFKGIWMPKFLNKRELPKTLINSILPQLSKKLAWLEKYARPRGLPIIQNSWFKRLAGVLIFALTLSAFLAPPFSGLDTLPAMGVVLVSVALIVDDILFFIAGIIVGLVGVVLEVTVGAAVFTAAKKLLAHASTPVKGAIIISVTLLILTLFLHHLFERKKSK